MANRRPIAPMDALWLAMDRPENLMVIQSVMFLREVPDWDEVTRVLRTRVVERYRVFRQRVEPPHLPGVRPHWVDDEEFDLARHVRRATLPSPGDDGTLQRYMEEQISSRLDPDHPLWEVHFLDGHGTGAAVLWRSHHSLADGLALGQVLLSMTDDSEVPQDGTSLTDSRPTGDPADSGVGVLASALGLARSSVGLARSSFGRALRWALPGGWRDASHLALDTGQVLDDLLLGHNPDNPVSGQPGAAKRIAWTRPLPLDGPKAVGRLAGATVNDVLLSAMAGALRTYITERGAEPVDLMTMVPVNLRDLRKPLPPGLGNRFTLIYLRYPSATAAPLARLAETKRRMDWLKQSPEIPLTTMLMDGIGLVGHGLDRPVIDFFANKALGVTTNVMGPRRTRLLAGVPLDGVLGWVPGSGTHTLGVCIFTYAGTVRVGVLTDAGLVPDPERLVAAFETEIDLLESLAERSRTDEEGDRAH